MSRITIILFFIVSVCQCIAGITIRPDEISITTSKPMPPIMQKLMKKPSISIAPTKMNKSNKTDETQVVAGDNRIRRLIPYISHYNPTSTNTDFNYPVEYLPVQQQQSIAIRKKPQQLQIPSIAVLYNPNKYPQPRPNVQAGFIYKIRPSLQQQQQHQQQPVMQSSYNSYKYQQPNVFHQIPNVPNHLTNNNKNKKTVAVSNEKNNFTPFSDSNKIPGEFVPIFKQKNLPYKTFVNDVKVVANEKDVVSRTPSLTPINYNHPMKPYDDDDFIPMVPYAKHHYHYHPSTISQNQNHLYHSKIINPPVKSTSSTPLTFLNLNSFKPTTPDVIYVTTSTERPTNNDYPNFSTTPSSTSSVETNYESPDNSHLSEYYNVKVTTYAPDTEYRKSIKTSANNIELESITVKEIEIPSPPELEILTSEIPPETSTKTQLKITKILNHLKSNDIITVKKTKKPQYNSHDYDYNNNDDDGNDSINHGRAGIDYPNFHHIPETNFSCRDQRYKGFFGDPETNCQVWHYCDLNGGKASFLCPNGTIFSQATLTCDWWFNVKCSSTPQLYVLNERLYKFILPFQPKFPEDYSGPLVDKYLEVKFQEMEEKMRREKEKGRKSSEDSDEKKDEQNEIDDELPGGTLEGADDDIQSLIHQQRSLTSTEKAADATQETLREPTTTTTMLPITAEASEEEGNFILSSSELPPIPNTIVDTQRLEMIEIKHDGASGHLTHEI